MSRFDRRLLVSALVSGLLLISIVAVQWIYERRLVEKAIDQSLLQAKEVRAAAQQLELQSEPAKRLAKIASQKDAADILDALTKQTPTDTWVFQLSIQAVPDEIPSVEFSAMTAASMEYLKTLERSPEFDHVKLVSAAPDPDAQGRSRIKLNARFSGLE